VSAAYKKKIKTIRKSFSPFSGQTSVSAQTNPVYVNAKRALKAKSTWDKAPDQMAYLLGSGTQVDEWGRGVIRPIVNEALVEGEAKYSKKIIPKLKQLARLRMDDLKRYKKLRGQSEGYKFPVEVPDYHLAENARKNSEKLELKGAPKLELTLG
jgi:hypothetical protein